MQLILFRHGIAEDREIFAATGRPDSERPLTGKGEQRTRAAAVGLVSVVPTIHTVGASPLIRARQTADIVADVYSSHGDGPPVRRDTVNDMQPGGKPSGVRAWLGEQGHDAVVTLVGHEPDLSRLLAWFTTGRKDTCSHFKKAGACLIDFPVEPDAAGGELLWFLPPSVLRRLAQ